MHESHELRPGRVEAAKGSVEEESPSMVRGLNAEQKKELTAHFLEVEAQARRQAQRFLSRLGRTSEVDDALQTARLKAFVAYPDFDSSAGLFSHWFRRILSRVLIDMTRRNAGRHARHLRLDASSEEGDKPALGERIASKDKPADEVMMSGIQTDALEKALRAMETMSPKRTLIMRMVYLNGLSTHEVADRLGIKEGSVLTGLFKGREALLAYFKDRGVTAGDVLKDAA